MELWVRTGLLIDRSSLHPLVYVHTVSTLTATPASSQIVKNIYILGGRHPASSPVKNQWIVRKRTHRVWNWWFPISSSDFSPKHVSFSLYFRLYKFSRFVKKNIYLPVGAGHRAHTCHLGPVRSLSFQVSYIFTDFLCLFLSSYLIVH